MHVFSFLSNFPIYDFSKLFNFLLQVEFVGGPMCWNTKTFSATARKIKKSLFKIDHHILFCINYYGKVIFISFYLLIYSLYELSGGGAFCNGQKIQVSQTDKVPKYCIPKSLKSLSFYAIKFSHISVAIFHYLSTRNFFAYQGRRLSASNWFWIWSWWGLGYKY